MPATPAYHPDKLLAPCPKHGVTEFGWVEMANWWMCLEGLNSPLGGQDPNYCCYVILDEDYLANPDGADVVDFSKRVVNPDAFHP